MDSAGIVAARRGNLETIPPGSVYRTTPGAGRERPDLWLGRHSLADIGYTLPGASGVASAIKAGPAIRIREEAVTNPAVFYDRHGRVVRVVRD